MIRAIRLLSLIALGCVALAIWYAIRFIQVSLHPPFGDEFAGVVEYILAYSLALGIGVLLLSAVILGIIVALRRRQWGWLATIAAFAVGTGAVLFDLARENCFPVGENGCTRGGFLTSAFEALAPRVVPLPLVTSWEV